MTLEVDVHGVFDLMGLAFAICEYERRRVVFGDGEGEREFVLAFLDEIALSFLHYGYNLSELVHLGVLPE